MDHICICFEVQLCVKSVISDDMFVKLDEFITSLYLKLYAEP